jgi:hypothetical protein
MLRSAAPWTARRVLYIIIIHVVIILKNQNNG